MDEQEYEFVASGDACAVCQALDGTDYTGEPHDNCLCQTVPKEQECEVELDYQGYNRGPGEFDGSVAGEITVMCPDGSTISESIEFDLGPYADSGMDADDVAAELFDVEAEALCDQCPEPEPFLCC